MFRLIVIEPNHEYDDIFFICFRTLKNVVIVVVMSLLITVYIWFPSINTLILLVIGGVPILLSRMLSNYFTSYYNKKKLDELICVLQETFTLLRKMFRLIVEEDSLLAAKMCHLNMYVYLTSMLKLIIKTGFRNFLLKLNNYTLFT